MAEVAADGDLLDPGLLRRLESLRMVSRRLSRSSLRGERRSRARGYSIEFADYRNYVEGDDLRYLDWNLYGRLDRLFLRLFEEDRELPVSIFLDCSESMNFGTPLKFDFARRVAAAIAHVALHGGDRVGVHPFPRRPENEALRLPLSRVRGGRSSLRLAGDLARLSCGGGSELNAELRRGALEVRTAGLAVVVSDLLCHGGYQQGIQALLSRRFQVALVQVLSPEELSPGRFGDLKFVDRRDRSGPGSDLRALPPGPLPGHGRRLPGAAGRALPEARGGVLAGLLRLLPGGPAAPADAAGGVLALAP